MLEIYILFEKDILPGLLVVKIGVAGSVWNGLGTSNIEFDWSYGVGIPLKRMDDPHDFCSGIIDDISIFAME